MAGPSRKNILAAFGDSLAAKEPPAVAAAPGSVPVQPEPVLAPELSGPPASKPAPAPAPPSKERPAVPPMVETAEVGFQRITVSLTASDLQIAEDKRYEIAQGKRVVLDRSKLLKVALRALDPNHPDLSKWIAEVVGADQRKAKK